MITIILSKEWRIVGRTVNRFMVMPAVSIGFIPYSLFDVRISVFFFCISIAWMDESIWRIIDEINGDI